MKRASIVVTEAEEESITPSPLCPQNTKLWWFEVQPLHSLAAFAAGYSGGLKYRIFAERDFDQPITTFFIPSANKTSYAKPYLGHLVGSGNRVSYGTQKLAMTGLGGQSMARERLYPVDNTNWIDMYVPFQSHYTFLDMQNDNTKSRTGNAFGWVAVVCDKQPEVYQSVADDFRLTLWRPPVAISYEPGTAPPGGAPSGRQAVPGGIFWP